MRKKSRFWLAFTLLALTTLLAPLQSACGQDYPKLAPYSAIRWQGEAPEVQVEGTWYALRSIDGLAADQIVAFAKEQHERIWQKRFDEDLVQVLSEMGHEPGKSVRLVLGDLLTDKDIVLEQAPMTKENRRAIMHSKYAGRSRSRSLSVGTLEREHLQRALDELQIAINERWSYRHANGADFDSAVNALRKRLDTRISANDFGIELQKIIALGLDGHAGISGYDLPSQSYLSFLMEPDGQRFIAFWPDRSDFLEDGFPYLTKIDGKAVTDWCDAASVLIPKGSPQYLRRHCLRFLRDLDYLRGLTDLPQSDSVRVELTSKDGKTHKTATLPMARQRPFYGIWPRTQSRLLEGNVGYLRLPEMDPVTSVQEIRTWMRAFRETNGLVVDVRDNGGGSRDALLLLYSYLAGPEDPPRVVNAAVYRLHNEHRKDHLAPRFMYRADATRWTEQERGVVADFAKTFSPEWQPPKGQFSDWHYLVLSRLDDPDVYHYSKPVVVLMNAKCFSATDIFLAGFKGMKNVTLLGAPSGGGSARSQSVDLGETPFTLRIGSMASFQADGKLFDGNGVLPDVMVESAPEYYIGGSDNMLEEALKRISER